MGLFDRWRRRRQARRALRLRKRLRRNFGAKDVYTAAQVSQTLDAQRGQNAHVLRWALALYCSSREFAEAAPNEDYNALRQELDALFSNSGADFSHSEGLSDAQAVGVSSSVDGGAGGFGDGGGGDSGGGGD